MVDLKALTAPFDPDEISWRIGSMKKDKTAGMALAYLDARNVMDRLDEVCGPAGWQCRYTHAGQKTVCDIGILFGDWVWKADGAGDSDIEAEKGALSDAFKRAAVRWGIGRYLYGLKSPWVEVDEWKRIKPAEYKKLTQILREYTRSLLDPAPKAPGVTRPEVFAAEARADGLTTETRSVGQIAAANKAKIWADTAIETLNFASTSEDVDGWFVSNEKALHRLEENHSAQYDRVCLAADNARDRFKDRAA